MQALPPALARELQTLLPRDGLILDPAGRQVFECDGLPAYCTPPLAVALPETREQVAGVLAACARWGVPVVPRGAGTGLSGGALPDAQGLLLVLARLRRILSIDPVRLTARVEPGVRNLAISEAAAAHGLYYAPDPSSQIACSIGGNIAENAGGVHCLKAGLTLHNLLGLECLNVRGEAFSIGGEVLESVGPDFRALVCGSEGLLAVVVEATLRLLPQPEAVVVLLADFMSVDAAADAVAQVIAAGITPAGLEMMDQLALRAAEDFANAGYPRDAAAILICELDGSALEVSETAPRTAALLLAAGARNCRASRDAEERRRFWLGRKSAFPAMGRIAPNYYCMDGTIPREHLGRVLRHIAALSASSGLPVANVFHAGDGNLHPLICYDGRIPGELAKAEAVGHAILTECVAVGGTITGEHGVGVEKLDAMCVQFNADELAVFHAIKHAFDPNELLNPGKAIPSLHRCAEFGARHFHHTHVEPGGLERF